MCTMWEYEDEQINRGGKGSKNINQKAFSHHIDRGLSRFIHTPLSKADNTADKEQIMRMR